MRMLVGFFQSLFNRIFHTRSIIIISAHKTNHVSLSGALQFGCLAIVVGCIAWASYSTGKYMATSSTLEERNETIKSVAKSRIDTNFNYTIASMPNTNLGPLSPTAKPKALTDPTYTLSAVNRDKLYARIALLENKVRELKSTNAEIIHTVREKTRDKIFNMEKIIQQTGLNPDRLKKEAYRIQQRQPSSRSNDNAEKSSSQGGPFIPAEFSSPALEKLSEELDDQLDEVAVLQIILNRLPLALPIDTDNISSNFGRRVDPFTRRPAFHAGIDLSGAAGSVVASTGIGKVVHAGWKGAYGNLVDIDHGFGVVTRYGHLSKVTVKSGDTVHTGDAIGIQGSTGRSTGPHLHYEVRLNGKPINPSKFVKAGYNVSKIQ